MKRNKPRNLPFACKRSGLGTRALAALVLAVAGPSLLAAPAGVVTHLSGAAVARTPDGQTRFLTLKSTVEEGDILATADNSYARVKFRDGAELVLRPTSQVKVEQFSFEEQKPQADGFALSLLKGGFRAVTGLLGRRSPENMRIATPSATIGIRGTHLGALFCANDCGGVPTPTGKTPDNGLHVDVAAGAVVVTPKLTVALPGAAPQPTPPGGTPAPKPAAPGVSPQPAVPAAAPKPGAAAPTHVVVLNAGQFGYLPPPQNGVQPPLVLVPPNQAVQVRMPMSISQNSPQGSPAGKTGGNPECVVQ